MRPGEEQWRRFRAGEDGAMARVTLRDLEDHGLSVQADMLFNDGNFWTVVDPARSNPRHRGSLMDLLRDGTGTTRFTLEGEVPFIPARARASRLRDAYLAAFSLLGYRYIQFEELNEVRRRIREADPPASAIRKLGIRGIGQRGVFVITAPVESVMVVVDGTAVFLPWPQKGRALTDWLEREELGGDVLNMRGFEWPTDMPMQLDLPTEPRALTPCRT